MKGGGLTRHMVVASGLLALVVGAAFGVLLLSIDQMRDAATLSRHSESVLVAANRLERLVVDLETGTRGFIITGEESLLAPWSAARRAFPQVNRELNELAQVPVQDRRARQLGRHIASYLNDYSVPLVRAARRGDASVRSAAVTGDGQRRVDAIRAEFDRLVATERALARVRQESSDDAARRAFIAGAAGLAGSILLILLFASYLTRAIVRPVRRAADMAGRLAGGDLGVRMPETGIGEIGALERAFNTMGRSLQASRDELTASRSRIVAAADQMRRRIERDLHDGTQQRLVSIGLELRGVEAMLPPGSEELRAQLARTTKDLAEATQDLQELSRGIHPAILSQGGLAMALRTLARRSAVPVDLDVRMDRRLPEQLEVAAYYIVSEALTNAAKHARASVVHVNLAVEDSIVRLEMRDDGVGGADPDRGSGLIGLRDRVEALGGRMEVESPAGGGTSLLVRIPVERGRASHPDAPSPPAAAG